MATLILPIIAAANTTALSAGAIAAWGAVSAGIGSYIDNAFIFPTLFPPDTSYGPRIDDQNISSAKEGAPKNICIGPECRTDGQMIWCTKLREVKDESNGGGKGGASGDFVVYKYFCHVAMAICENQINRVLKIWADGKLLYNIEPNINLTLGTACVGTTWNHTHNHDEGTLGPPTTTYSHFLKIKSSFGANWIDLSKYVSGRQTTLAGFTGSQAANNGTFTCDSSGVDAATGDSYVVFRINDSTAANPFVTFTLGTQSTATIFQDAPSFSQKQCEDIIFHYGTEDQLPDSVLESYEGVGNVPGFRGVAYVVFQNLALQDFGNRIPNFTFLVEADTAITVGDAIGRILAHAEVDSGLYDVSALQDQNLRGITLTGPQAPISDMQPILIAYNIAAQLRDGVLTFVYRQNLPVFAINVLDMAAKFSSESSGVPFRISDKIDYELNSNVTVEYMDPEKDYQTGTQMYVPANPLKPNPNTMTFPITFSSDDARKLAERLFWLQWISRQTVDFTLPPSYIYLREGDNVTFTYNGANYQVLIQQIDRGQESQFLVIQGTIEDPSIFTRNVATENSSLVANGFDGSRNYGYPGALMWTMLDIPALREEHLNKPGFYTAAACSKAEIPFAGASLYESTDGGSLYERVDTLAFAANIGYATTTLDLTVSAAYWDDVSSLTVVMTNGSLSSCTEQQCLNGVNRAAIGGEVIGFMNAVLVAENTYTLTHLLRGLRGTEAKITLHVAEEVFVHLNGPGIVFHDLTLAAIGQTRSYKMVPSGGYVELEDAVTIHPSAVTLRAFAPSDLIVSKDGSNNITASFSPRSRALGVDFMPQNMPFLEERDIHDVSFYSSVGAFKRTKTSADGIYSVTYTTAEQTADGLTPGAALQVKVVRRSSRTFGNSSVQKLATPIPL